MRRRGQSIQGCMKKWLVELTLNIGDGIWAITEIWDGFKERDLTRDISCTVKTKHCWWCHWIGGQAAGALFCSKQWKRLYLILVPIWPSKCGWICIYLMKFFFFLWPTFILTASKAGLFFAAKVKEHYILGGSLGLWGCHKISRDLRSIQEIKVLNIGIVSDGGFSYWILDIGGDIGDTHAYRTFISDIIYNEILITKSWFSVIDTIYLIKMM